MVHSIDFHAVTGPGGGAAFLQVPPGQEKTITFKALNPGLYVYHCATPSVAEHISAGIYFGVGGPNKVSSFHVIGEIFDRVYAEASTSAPRENVQTTLVPPGGARAPRACCRSWARRTPASTATTARAPSTARWRTEESPRH